VVDGVVVHLTKDTRGANEVWKLGEKGVDRKPPLMTFTGGLQTGSLGRGRQRRDSIRTVHQEAEMGEEVGPDEGLFDVGHHELPRELPA
jgi:hypothetical protein